MDYGRLFLLNLRTRFCHPNILSCAVSVHITGLHESICAPSGLSHSRALVDSKCLDEDFVNLQVRRQLASIPSAGRLDS